MSQKLEEAYLECLLPGQLMVHTVNVDGCRRFCRDSELPGMQAYIDTVVAASGDNPAGEPEDRCLPCSCAPARQSGAGNWGLTMCHRANLLQTRTFSG